MDMLSVMGGGSEKPNNKTCLQRIVFVYSKEYSPFCYHGHLYHTSVIINVPVISFFGGLGILFHTPFKSYL